MPPAPEAPAEAEFPFAAARAPRADPGRMRARQSAVVAELGLQALRNDDLDALMGQAVEAVAETLRHEMCKVLELLPDRRALLLRSGVGWHEGLAGRGTVSAGLESQAGYTLMSEHPVVVEDLRTERRFDGPPLLHNHGVISGMSTVIYTSRGPWGVLGTHARSRHDYTEEDVNFLVAVANILGAAIDRRAAEERLQAAHARLQEIDRAKTLFLHNVSHEMRTPLTPLLLQLERIEQTAREAAAGKAPDLERHARAAEIARRSAQRLGRLVEDFVDVGRIQTGRLTVERVPVDLAKVAGEAAELWRPLAAEKALTVSVRSDGPLPILGDPHRLAQVVGNLVSNAVKFTPEGGRIEVACGAEGDLAVVRVRDDGLGLTPEQRAMLFEPFSQAGRSDVERTGSGLGLYISRGIVEQHGGQIGVESPGPGEGATFWFSLRLAEGSRLTERVGVAGGPGAPGA